MLHDWWNGDKIVSQITEAQTLFPDAEVVFQSHNWPHWGNDVVNEYLTNTAVDKFMHDQTLLYINEGYTADEIAAMIQLPEALEKVWYTRQYYGTLKHNVKAVYQKYMGWYDANPIHLDGLEPIEYAKKLVEYLGDADKVLEMARRLCKGRIPVGRGDRERAGLRRPGQSGRAVSLRRRAGAAGLSGRVRRMAKRLSGRRV